MTFQPPTRSKNCRKSGFFRDLRLYVTEYVKINFVAVLKGSTPFTRSINSTVLNSNLANEALLKLPLECAFVCNSVCNFLCKKPLPSTKEGNGKIFQFFLNRGEICQLKRPIESRERPRRPNSPISTRGSSLLRPSRSPL